MYDVEKCSAVLENTPSSCMWSNSWQVMQRRSGGSRQGRDETGGPCLEQQTPMKGAVKPQVEGEGELPKGGYGRVVDCLQRNTCIGRGRIVTAWGIALISAPVSTRNRRLLV